MNVYLIVILIAVVFIVYIVVLSKYSSSRKKQQLEKFTNQNSKLNFDGEKVTALCYGTISAILNKEQFYEIIPLDGLDKSYYGLKRIWEITTKEQAKSVLDKLLNLDSSHDVDELIKSHSIKKLNEIQRSISKLLDIPIDEVTAVTSTFAYDLSRAIEVAKWSFWNDYLTEDDFFKYIATLSYQARQLGKDWEEYSISFLLGFTLDTPSPENLDECQEIVKGLLKGNEFNYLGMNIPAIYTVISFKDKDSDI